MDPSIRSENAQEYMGMEGMSEYSQGSGHRPQTASQMAQQLMQQQQMDPGAQGSEIGTNSRIGSQRSGKQVIQLNHKDIIAGQGGDGGQQLQDEGASQAASH